jgi:hypothetical protein
MSNVFLLGCERSGSTWLANIFDAHPDVELWMEPFADYAELFPGVPDRSTWVGEPGPELERALQDGYARLPRLKYPLLHRPGASPRLLRAEQALLRSARRWLRRGLRSTPRALERYELLQLNAVETPVDHLTRKHSRPTCHVTKELRLNLKTGLLHGCFPDARFIVAVREPGAQVTSILGWLDRGRLGELARALEPFEAKLCDQDRLAPFARALADRPATDSREHRLAVWWAVNYAVLLSDLESGDVQHRVVNHRRLSEAPAEQAAALLDFAGLEPDASVEGYIAWSSANSPRSGSPTETARRSAEHAHETLRDVAEPVREAVTAVLARLRDADLLPAALARALEE